VTTELEFLNIGHQQTIVSFTGIGHGMGAIQMNEFFRLGQQGFNVLFVRDTKRSWYNSVDVGAIRRMIGDDPVISIGNSMGAFHAAMFAMDHPVTKVIAFAIQYSIHPEVVPFDRRYRQYAAKIDNWRFRELTLNNNTEYYFISGDDHLEQRHLNLIPPQPNVSLLVIPKAGHKVAAKLKAEGRLYSTIHEILNAPPADNGSCRLVS
jgi:pimeloyl-ACP methyl ester carboxylesterase